MKSRRTTPNFLFTACSIGVDVCKSSLDLTGFNKDGGWYRQIPNRREPILAFLMQLDSFSGPIICESTRWYHLLFAHLCYERGFDIRVINPLLSSKHSKSAIRKVKTDPADSRTLAIMGITEPDLPSRADLSMARIRLKKKLGLLHSLEKWIQSQRRSLRDYQAFAETMGIPLSAGEEMLKQSVEQLEQTRKSLEKEITALIDQASTETGQSNQAVLNSIPGFSTPVSGQVATLLDPQAPSAKSWIGFVGLDISVRMSGHWKGKCRLTKRGNPYLRKRLYQAAWGACINYPEIRQYYDKLKQGGRKHREAVIIVARRLLRIGYTLIQKQQMFDMEKAFAA
ncbi:MAG: transposase [Lentisphaeria bacterium]|nr:transposase [Candidatus Neomarinimicrobiota bacterium]MCF7841402.1 transposase [Lentisphaeria bacterium]